MSKPKKGDLVHLYRRKIGGAGLLLKNIPNVEKDYNVNLHDIIKLKHNIKEVAWHLKTRIAIDQLYPALSPEQRVNLLNMVDVVETYCSTYDHAAKKRILKENYHKDFSMVRWLKPPGEYSSQPVNLYKETESWFPTSFLKVLK